MLTHSNQDHLRFANYSHIDDLQIFINVIIKIWVSTSIFSYVLDREQPLQLRLRWLLKSFIPMLVNYN